MKFKSDMDAKLFLIEIGKHDLVNETDKTLKPTNELIGLLKKKRSGLERGLKSFRRSQAGKGVWRKYGTDIMKGIKAFHKSTEGKRFHRNLGRFLVRKEFTGFITGTPLGNKVSESTTFWEKAEAIKAISSAKTHLFIEMEYYHPLYEQIGVDELVLNHINDLNEIEQKILLDEELTEENTSLLFLLTESNAIVKALAEESDKSIDEVKNIWDRESTALVIKGSSEDEKNFYGILTTSVKKALKIK